MAGKDARWCSPELLWLLFDYCFTKLKVRLMLCACDTVNIRSMRQIERAGWQPYHRILGGTPSGDLMMFSMTRDECPWLKLRPRYVKVNGAGGEMAHAVT
jgi:RimJ/RimL family protein N-acetyltransferase